MVISKVPPPHEITKAGFEAPPMYWQDKSTSEISSGVRGHYQASLGD